MPRLAAAFVLAASITALTHAAELVTLGTMAATGALDPLAREFERQSGHTIAISYDTGPNLARRLAAGERGDIVVAPATVIDQAVRDGRVVAGSQASIGRVGVGIAVRRGARVPDVTSAAALKQALLDADAIFYSQGTSGAHVASVFTTLGIADAIKAKTMQLANGGVVMERVIADRRNVIGFTMVSEVQLMAPKGATLAGPLPGALQNYTPYAAAVLTSSSNAAASRQFIAFLTNAAGKARFTATGWEP